MAETNPRRSSIISVNTAETLAQMQQALTLAKETDNLPLANAAESVISRLVLSLKHDRTSLSGDIRRLYEFAVSHL